MLIELYLFLIILTTILSYSDIIRIIFIHLILFCINIIFYQSIKLFVIN
jgi:hypothetical protein